MASSDLKAPTNNPTTSDPAPSNEDEDDGPGSRFDDFSSTINSNGSVNCQSNQTQMAYYIESPSSNFYNSSLGCSQGQLISTDGSYLVVELDQSSGAAAQRASPQTVSCYNSTNRKEDSERDMKCQSQVAVSQSQVAVSQSQVAVSQSQDVTDVQNNSVIASDPMTVRVDSSTGIPVSASGLLLNHPFTIHNSTSTPVHHVVSVQTVAAVSNPTSVNSCHSTPAPITCSLSNPPGQHASSASQNLRDMDIVHVQWLSENYETADGVSLPRSTLYNHYLSHCSQHDIEPVNAASFGKLIRSVFVGLRTRRLGTRGNSKYHYYGIRVKPGSSLTRVLGGGEVIGSTSTESIISNSGQPPVKRSKVSSKQSSHHVHPVTNHNNNSHSNHGNNVHENHQSTLAATSPEMLQTYLGDPKSILPNVWPDEPTVPSNSDSDSPSVLATKFAACYRKHYEEIINCLGNLNFNLVEAIWFKFWQPESSKDHVRLGRLNQLTLTIGQLLKLTSTSSTAEESNISSLADWIIQTDYTLYNSLITSLLLPHLLKPIPQQLTQQIRNFAKNITGWMKNALDGYDETFVALKLEAVGAFSHTLRRYTSLNHLSSAARAVLQNQQQISQMICDLNRVDFKNVQEQAFWVCNCDDVIVDNIEQSFKQLLQQDHPYDRWSSWCDEVLDSCLSDSSDVRSATQFFFKWGFYSSLVMRDLTLRSASSFGSFHLIRLLFDEYIFYQIEARVAKATSKTPLQVLGEARSIRGPLATSMAIDGSV